MNKRQKQSLLFTLIGLVGLLLILFVLWKWGGKRDFETFVDQYKVFSIKYPAHWTYNESKMGDVAFISTLESELDFFHETVTVTPLPAQDVDLEAYSAEGQRMMVKMFGDTIRFEVNEDVRFAGHRGHKMVFRGVQNTNNMKMMMIWTVFDGWSYQITFLSLEDTYDEYYEKYVDKMIKSIKIIRK